MRFAVFYPDQLGLGFRLGLAGLAGIRWLNETDFCHHISELGPSFVIAFSLFTLAGPTLARER